ncbi:LTXXQ domain protein [Stutzerimonas urumqiensis]|uniref:Spy/CpxP family protein refolding chaperone n=1 Tax=Stutzerimonas urumqiensis TaxID=638269 RepID=UPI003DA501E6
MRKTLIALVFTAALPGLAMAMPDGEGGRHHGKHDMHHPFKELDLTKEQRKEMRELMGKQWQAHRDIVQRYLDKLPEAERKAMQDELTASRQSTHEAIRALMKPEQVEKFDKLHAEMEAKRTEKLADKTE